MTAFNNTKVTICLGVLAITAAACGSTQSTSFANTATTKAPAAKTASVTKPKGNYLDGMFVGQYTGQYAQDVVIAKKAVDLMEELQVKTLEKANTNAIVQQMHFYLGTGETSQLAAGYQKELANGDTVKLTKGTSNLNGIDQAPVIVTPVAPFRGQPAVVVSTCGYRGAVTYGPNGKFISPDSAAAHYAWQISVTNLQLMANTSIYGYRAVGTTHPEVSKCPTN